MQQQLEAYVTMQIPEHLILVEKAKYKQLEDDAANQIWVGMDWLKQATNIKNPATLREKLLYPYRKELEPFVDYPTGKEHWRFQRKGMKEWLEENFHRIKIR